MRAIRRLVLVVLAAAACGRGERTASSVQGAAAGAAGAPPAPAPVYRWSGIYAYDREHPTFRPCEYALAFPLRGSDSLLAVLAAKIDFQAPRPILRVAIAAAGDTTRLDPQALPVFTITGIGATHTPSNNECVPVSPPPAPPADERAVRAALAATGVQGGAPRIVSAYLDGDGQADALALLTSGATCSPAGCDLLAFRGTERGFALMSRTRHVKAPLVLREARSDGVRMLVVGVGQGGGFRDRDARLRFVRGRGYPADAIVEPPGIQDPNALVLLTP